MAFERIPVTETSATPRMAPQATPESEMRPERTIDPYSHSVRARAAAAQAGVVTTAPPTLPAAPAPAPKNGQPANTEPSAEAAASPEAAVTLSPQMAALARREQRFRSEETKFREQQKALEAERSEIAELKELRKRLEAKDFAGIEKYVPYDAYTNYLIEKTNGVSPEAEEIKNLSKRLEGVETTFKTSEQRQLDAARSEFKKGIHQLVESRPEFAAIKRLQASDAVAQHILDSAEQDGVELTPEQAAKEVLAELAERAKKLSSAFEEEKPATEVVEGNPAPTAPAAPMQPKPGIRTLANNMSGTGQDARPLKPLQNFSSDSDRYAEAERRARAKLAAQAGQRG